MNRLLGPLHPDNLRLFESLMPMYEGDEDPSVDNKDQNEMVEDDVFKKVEEKEDIPSDSNASIFLGINDTGSMMAVNSDISPNDAAIKGICNVIAGDIIKNSDNLTNYLETLFNQIGANDIDQEQFKKAKGAIWKKFEDVATADSISAYSSILSFIENTVNGLRTNSAINKNTPEV